MKTANPSHYARLRILPYFNRTADLHLHGMLRKIGLTLLAPVVFAFLVVAMVVVSLAAVIPVAGIITVTLWRAFTQNKFARVK